MVYLPNLFIEIKIHTLEVENMLLLQYWRPRHDSNRQTDDERWRLSHVLYAVIGSKFAPWTLVVKVPLMKRVM